MLTERDQQALKLLNDGVDASGSSETQAIERWEKALTLEPTAGLEALIRGRLVYTLLTPLIKLEEGTVLSQEQAKRYLRGEKHLIRLHGLVSNDAAEERLRGLNAEDLKSCRTLARDYAVLPLRAGLGWYILPGDESISRLIEYGYSTADAGQKMAAIPPLQKALTLIDEERKGHKEYAYRARLRLAALLNDVGKRSEARQHASWILNSGMADDKLRSLMEVLLEAADEYGDTAPPPGADGQSEKRTPLFFEANAAMMDGREADELWLEVLQKELSLLDMEYQVIAISEACDVFLDRRDFGQVERWANRGLEIARALKPDKANAPFHTNLLECLSRIAVERKDFDRAARLLKEAVDIPFANVPNLYVLQSLLCFKSDDAPQGARYLVSLVEHPSFEDYFSRDHEKIGRLFKITFLSFKDGSLDKEDHLKTVIEAWSKVDVMWDKADSSNPRLSEIRSLAKEFSKSRCFIATACCGAACPVWVETLVTFRESVLRPSAPGRWFITLYEATSPPLARIVSSNIALKLAAKWLIVAPFYVVAKYKKR